MDTLIKNHTALKLENLYLKNHKQAEMIKLYWNLQGMRGLMDERFQVLSVKYLDFQCHLLCARMAQLLEALTMDQRVRGSSPWHDHTFIQS